MQNQKRCECGATIGYEFEFPLLHYKEEANQSYSESKCEPIPEAFNPDGFLIFSLPQKTHLCHH